MRITRKDAKAALEQLPTHEILGHASKALTHKQREFARQIALGETKASAYRKAYKSNASVSTLNNEPYRLASDPRINREIEAYTLALEGAKYRTPTALRELVVQSLVQVLIDPESTHSARINAARVLGTVTEVSAFTDRKQITHVSSSDDARKIIMDQLTALIKAEAIDVDPAQLLQELERPHPSPTPPDADAESRSHVHTNPLKSSGPTPDENSWDKNIDEYDEPPGSKKGTI